jgi:UDP-N-acetylglucosamine 2-epimerase (non-hydrolysing)
MTTVAGNAAVRVGVVLGTRPEAIKLAPVIHELRGRPGMEPFVVSTGQHRTMLEQALAAFDLHPDADLRVMTPGQTLHEVTSRTLHGLRELLAEQPLDWLVVQGDTTTAFAAALAGFYARIPVAHVEAGLRSGQRYSPFPEEINRRLVDQLSQLLFAPTEASRQLLLSEGFAPRQVEVTGNTVVDALMMARQLVRARHISVPELPPGALVNRRMLLVTAHRRESFGPGLAAIFRALRRLADDVDDSCVVYPVHLNPEVDGPARDLLGGHPRIHLIRPLAYLEFVAAMESAHLVLTDSGGVQEEVPTLRKPLLVMRDVTERPEGIAAGVACLAGTSEERIYGEARRLLDDQAAYRRMASGHNPYGDGQAARRIVDRLATESALENRLAS